MDAKCVKCHNGTKVERINLTILGLHGAADRAYIHYKVFSNEMPPGAPLSDEEVALFKDYVARLKK